MMGIHLSSVLLTWPFYLQQIEMNNNEELEYQLAPKMEFFA
jgi:hypothetical protein